jgi:hypothetical protein
VGEDERRKRYTLTDAPCEGVNELTRPDTTPELRTALPTRNGEKLLATAMLTCERCSRTPHSNAKHSGGETAQRFCCPAPKVRTGAPCYWCGCTMSIAKMIAGAKAEARLLTRMSGGKDTR